MDRVRRMMFYPLAVYVLLIGYILLSYTVLAMSNDILSVTIHEDQYFELIGALGFFVTAILFFISFILSLRRKQEITYAWMVPLVFFGLFIIFIFGAGEEISWGQRIFNIGTPESLSAINRQDELNLHNLEAIDGGQFLSADRLFDLFWFSFVLVLPLGYALFPLVRRFFAKLFGQFPPVPHGSIGLLFLLNYLWAKVAIIIFESTYNYERIPFRQAVQEIKESNYGILFVLVGLYFVLQLRQTEKEP